MLVIFEGPDRAGKSTLVQSLVNKLHADDPDCSVEVIHRGPPKEHPLVEYERSIQDYQPRSWPGVASDPFRRHVICDRWHLGEVVYPPLASRPSQFTHEALWHVEMFLQARGAVLVWVDAPTRVLINRTRRESRHDLPAWQTDEVLVDQVRSRFTSAALGSRVPLLKVMDSDTAHFGGPTDVAKKIWNVAVEREVDTAPLAKFVTYVGPRWPQLLVLGDVRKRADVDPGGPAFVPYGGTSGAYLLRSMLEYACVDRDAAPFVVIPRIGLGNACDVDDPFEMWDTVGRPRVVLLGRNAALRAEGGLRDLGATIKVVDHPQYVRRFHHSKTFEYGESILTQGVPFSFAGR